MNKQYCLKLLMLWSSIWLTGCASTTMYNASTAKAAATDTLQQINQLLSQINEQSEQHYQFDKVSECRYEISATWSNPDKGYYHATNRQRFSMAYDLRNIEYLPAYAILYGNEVQHRGERIELSFNRSVPATFEFVDSSEFEVTSHSLPSNRFNLGGYSTASKPAMTKLLAALKHLAKQCGNDLGRLDSIATKVIGRWQIVGLSDPEGTITIEDNQATLVFAKQQSITGNYHIEPQGQYFQMQLTPNNGGTPYYLWLDFVSSNYARLLMLGTSPKVVPFAPIWQNEPSQQNAEEKKLFRLGDLR